MLSVSSSQVRFMHKRDEDDIAWWFKKRFENDYIGWSEKEMTSNTESYSRHIAAACLIEAEEWCLWS